MLVTIINKLPNGLESGTFDFPNQTATKLITEGYAVEAMVMPEIKTEATTEAKRGRKKL